MEESTFEPTQEWNDNCVYDTYEKLNETLCYLEKLAKIDTKDEEFPKAIEYIKKTIKEHKELFDTELGWRVLE